MSETLVKTYLPYKKVVYDLEDKSGNARRVERWREKNHNGSTERVSLGDYEGHFS